MKIKRCESEDEEVVYVSRNEEVNGEGISPIGEAQVSVHDKAADERVGLQGEDQNKDGQAWCW